MSASPTDASTTPILVVIPVYGDLQATRQCLESVVNSPLPDNTSLLVIDDHSPEREVSDYCRALAAEHGFDLLRNEQNEGFVVSANRGLQYRPDADVILLNSDTAVSGDWVRRLHDCAWRDQNTGTVTPFSNNGTICSYPLFNQSNPLPALWQRAELDALFQSANAGAREELPTGVGFCLYIRRACLEDTGYFDSEHFGQGYGEECDFCLRASGLGWKHMLAADTFVYHQGGASFAGESLQRKQQADALMRQLHPHYDALVTDFIARDPLRQLRRRVDLARIASRPEDADQVLRERDEYATEVLGQQLTASRELAAEQRQELALLHEQLRLERAERERLQLLLEECRASFADTDRALQEAQRAVAAQQRDIADGQREIAALTERLHGMEQSRSWRYTAWLRRGD